MSSARRRVGLLVPAINVMVEDELVLASPPDLGLHIDRLDVDRSLPLRDQFAQMVAEAPARALVLSKARVEALGFACTSASFFEGPDADRRLTASIEAASHLPAVSTSGALVAALRHLGVGRIALATPYVKWVWEAEAGYFEAAGFEVRSAVGLDRTGGADIAELSEEEVRDLVATADRPEAEAVVVSCTDLPVMPLIEGLETHHGKPVVASNQALLWALRRAVGLGGLTGYGLLLSS